ncbi:hypothetical protein, conserved [Trypanosoma brucei brucei TREU927]|uniref:Uncharacterized protein n=1 Tax=Trypanosoma brucei brucei (strain 927/4 GUTat10.1) TaxID=185431 RepID=Q388N0_TRYB2|nr:hypothetical protein, conserved [Trypanosoma brucei brucei TREU927]EAN78740.1 hypothetical protein, conserved [Trypanosoma brucei brucei TREU927]
MVLCVDVYIFIFCMCDACVLFLSQVGWGRGLCTVMTFISFHSLAEALRSAFPCLPRLMLRWGYIVLRKRGDFLKRTGETRCPTVAPNSLLPLSATPCYYCPEGVQETLLNYINDGNFRYPTISANPVPSMRDWCVGSSSAQSLLLSTTKVSVEPSEVPGASPTPIIIQLFRCEQRLNIADCMRTRLLQKELRRTEGGLQFLHQLSKGSNLMDQNMVAALESKPSLAAESVSTVSAVETPYSGHIVWEKDGWFFDDIFSSSEIELPASSSDSTGYWRAWIVPFRGPFSKYFLPRMQDIHQFHVEEDITLMNVDFSDRANQRRYSANYSSFHAGRVLNYWAATGEPVQLENRMDNEDMEENDDAQIHLASTPCCWFTMTEISERKLCLRHGGTVRNLPFHFDCCGFFLHLCPPWFVLSEAEVLQRYPISNESLVGACFIPEYGNTENVVSASRQEGPLCGGVIFVLQELGEWRVFPHQHVTVNFGRVSLPSTDSLHRDKKPLLFVEINAAVEMMYSWSSEHCKQTSVECDFLKQVIDIFLSISSKCSAASFINSFIGCCGHPLPYCEALSPLADAKDSPATLCIPGTEDQHMPHVVETNRTPYSLNSGEMVTRVSHLQPGVYEGLIEVGRSRSKRTSQIPNQKCELPFIHENNLGPCDDAWDIGIVLLSFEYCIPAVKAMDTELVA